MNLEKYFELGWYRKLSPFITSSHFKPIAETLSAELKAGVPITPLFDDTFRAFKECPYNKLKVVILGLDPYPGVNKDGTRIADGIAFSARNNLLNPPKSLSHIINAMEKDAYGGFGIGFNEDYMNPDLTRWASQGVLLLNQALTTHVGKTGVHLDLWRPFVQMVFHVLRQANTGLIFVLLGAPAKWYRGIIQEKSNYVLTASHPSSINYNGKKEWDCEGLFSTVNNIIEKNNGKEEIILW